MCCMNPPWEVLSTRRVHDGRPFVEVACETVRLPDGRRVGTVTAVESMPGNDCWVVRLVPDAEGEARDCLVPAVAPILSRVDLRARVAVIDPPPGLLDP